MSERYQSSRDALSAVLLLEAAAAAAAAGGALRRGHPLAAAAAGDAAELMYALRPPEARTVGGRGLVRGSRIQTDRWTLGAAVMLAPVAAGLGAFPGVPGDTQFREARWVVQRLKDRALDLTHPACACSSPTHAPATPRLVTPRLPPASSPR